MSDLIPQYLTHLRAGGRSERTVGARAEILARLDRQLPCGIEQATSSELAEWLSEKTWGEWTRVTYYHAIRDFYRWCARGSSPHLDYDPAAELIRPEEPRDEPDPVSDEELRLALARSSTRWRLTILLAAYAGLRVGDLCRIRRESVGAEILRIRRGKGRRDAAIPTHPAIWAMVEPRPRGLLLPGQDGRQMRSATLSAAARRHFDKIGLPDVHLHRFRHWFGTWLSRPTHLGGAGADVFTVQHLMRHSSPVTTQRYVQVTGEQRRLAIHTLPALGDPDDQYGAA